MIKESMFFADPKIKDYREISLDDVLTEYLLCKGTWDSKGNEINKKVSIKSIVDSALFIYNLKSNSTNKKAVEYYCEREACRRMLFSENSIVVPDDIWNKCNMKNKEFTGTK